MTSPTLTSLYRSVFKSDSYLDLYLALRAEGDNHLTAVETIRGEKQMETLKHLSR